MKFLTVVLIAVLVLLPGVESNTMVLAAETNAPAVVEFEGTVVPAREAEITPIVSGWLNKINFAPGQYVREGDVLFEFSQTLQQLKIKLAEAQLAGARAAVKNAEAKLARAKILRSRNVVSEADLEEAEATRDLAAANVEQAEVSVELQKTDLSYLTQKAPFSGVMGEPLVRENGWQDVGRSGRDSITMAVITQLDPIRIVGEIPYSIYAERRKVFKTDEDTINGVVLQIVLPEGAVYQQKGKLVSSGYKFNEDTQKLKVWAEFANPDLLLRPGLKVTVRSRLATGNGG